MEQWNNLPHFRMTWKLQANENKVTLSWVKIFNSILSKFIEIWDDFELEIYRVSIKGIEPNSQLESQLYHFLKREIYTCQQFFLEVDIFLNILTIDFIQ